MAALWRAGARCLKDQLSPWISTWQQHFDAGGLPGTSVANALMQVHQALKSGATHFAQLDVAAYFDSVHPEVLRKVLLHLRFPQELLDVIGDFYDGAERVFCLQSAHSISWQRIAVGVAQGCPLSPLLTAAIGHVWSVWVQQRSCQGSVGALSYVDDRTLWLPPGRPLAVFSQALERYCAFGFSLSLDRCAIVCREVDHETSYLADSFKFKTASHLEILGVQAFFDAEWRLLKFNVRKAVLQLRLLRWVTHFRHLQKVIFDSLVVPCFSWAAGFARPSKAELELLRAETAYLFVPHFSGVSARVLVHEASGWQTDPVFACDSAALRTLWTACSKPPGWLETVPLCQARFRWHEMIPEAETVLANFLGTVVSSVDVTMVTVYAFYIQGEMASLWFWTGSDSTSGNATSLKLNGSVRAFIVETRSWQVAWTCQRLRTTVSSISGDTA